MNTIQLPDALLAQLRNYESRLKRMETVAAIAGGLAGLLITYVLLFVADRFINTPIAMRTALTITGGVLAALFAQSWARYWLWQKRGPAALAKLLQKHFRVLGDRLQGVIELTEGAELPENISPALLRAAIQQVAEDSGRHDFTKAVPVRSARRWALAAILVGALTITPFILAPKAATNAAERWAKPWADIERFTFTTVEKLPNELFVAHGEKFPLVVTLRDDVQWRPSSATAKIEGQEKIEAELLKGHVAAFEFPGQIKDGVIHLRVGDYLKDITVHPLHRPELRELAARVKLPEYLGYPEQHQNVQGSAAEFLTGSEVAFVGKINRPVGSGSLTVGEKVHAATTEGDAFTSPMLPLADLGSEFTLRWEDIHQLTPVQPYKLRVGASKDGEPRVEVQGMQEQELAILPNESVRFTLAASDDFGLKEMWVGWTAKRVNEKAETTAKKANQSTIDSLWENFEFKSAKKKAAPSGPTELPRVAGSQMTKELTRPLTWSPSELGIPQDTVVELTGYAVDYLPKRKPAASWKYTIYVLSPEKHAERIRERMDAVLKQLDERIRDEERALEEAKAITENKKDLPSERAGEEIKKVEASEKANEDSLQKLTEQMAAIMKDALRNKEILHDTLNDWSKIQEKLAQEASPEMKNAEGQMAQASQSPQQREQQMKQAQEHQEKALAAMREAASKMQTANENLFARNFYNRLRHAAASEISISDGLKKLAKMTVGLKPDEIGAGEKKEFENVAGKQTGAVKDVDGIQTDMTAFLRRVPNEKYQAVVGEMEETKVISELNELATFINANLGLKSVGRAKTWGDQLNKWAEMIQSECNCKGGQGEMDPDQMELMIAMVRAAVGQDGIRDQTNELEKQKDANPNYTADAGKLSVTQNQLAGTIKALIENPKFAKFMGDVGPVLEKSQELMGEVSGTLQKPKTDADVVSVEGIIIELLVPPDKKGGKKPKESMAQMQQRMQQMMQQMTQARKAGRNNAKSNSSLAGVAAEGAGAGRKANERIVDKSGGAANAGELPEEFRDALQSYFQQVEERSN
jgi:hypothetical protein